MSLSAPLSAQARAGFGAWIDASGARIEQPSQPRRDAAFLGFGAVRAGRLLSLAGQASLTSARDSAGAGQADFFAQFAPPRVPRLRTDIALSAVSYGWRAGSDRSGAVQLRESFEWTLSTGRSTATWVTASVAVTSRITVVGSTGRHLADPLRGIPAAGVSSVGFRLALGGESRPTAARAAGRSAGDIVITAQSPGNALVTVRVPAHHDDRVQVATSYGEWTPLEMERDGAWRVARIAMPSGSHRIAIRVNEGAWRAPRGTVAVRDDFGGTAGILIVP